MKILVSWLRDYIEVPVGPAELAAMLSMRGFEVQSIDEPPRGSLSPDDGAARQPDAVIDLDITPNRPDCLSVIGIAREVSTAYDLPLRLPEPSRVEVHQAGASGSAGATRVYIDDPDLCPRYAAGVADVEVSSSPAWLANRLVAAGVRPINNVVDVTNYVLLEFGHPLHAFDAHRLGGQIRIRRARAQETIVTIDGTERELEVGMLVIADASRPQAVAGVMGGAASEVWEGTRQVVLESAYFKPVSVRATSRRLGMTTEASARFERGADISAPVAALGRALDLLAAIGAGHATAPVVDCYPAPRERVTVKLRRDRIGAVVGQAVPDEQVERIFTRLGFDAARIEGGWQVTVPTARVDIGREIDLIEEVARHFGYDRLPTTFPPLTAFPERQEPLILRESRLRRLMTAGGYTEAVTIAVVEQAVAARFASKDEIVGIAYPLSEKFAVLRPSLLPGLVDAVSRNRRREQRDVRLFELGARFSAAGGERAALAWAAAGRAAPEHWSGTGRQMDFYDAKGTVEYLASAFGVRADFAPAALPFLAEGRAAAVSIGGREAGFVGQLEPALAESRGVPRGDEVWVAEIDLESFAAAIPPGEPRFTPLPRHPSIVRDLSVLVDSVLPAAAVRGTIVAAAPPTLVSATEFDRYAGAGIPEGRVSVSYRLTFRAADRTLTDAEVDGAMEKIVSRLVEEHRAVRR
ncbi:MAG: phenylalanine--tRNA ligase subunit beta [Vicinamibacterales bacterium]